MKVLVIDADGSDVEIDTLDFKVGGPEHRDASPAEMVRWRAALGEAVKRAELEAAAYRKWKGEATERVLAGNPKMAEWRVKSVVEADPNYSAMRDRVAESLRLQTTLEGVYEAARMRAGMHKGGEAADRAAAAGATARPDASEDARVQRMAEERRRRREEDESRGGGGPRGD